MRLNVACYLFALASCLQTATAQSASDKIRLNQLGFYPNGPKIAIITEAVNGEFHITAPGDDKKLFTGTLEGPQVSSLSGKQTWVADFSSFQKNGTYVVSIPSLGSSYPFQIKADVHQELAQAALKSYYHQRMSTDQPETYAGKWHRPLSHPDKVVYVHSSAADKRRPKDSTISSPGGWYDAGDYNKYIVNSGITTGTLLSLYEDFPDFFNSLEMNIPERDNGIPDLLDEVNWNLQWMLTMQDPADGGVYHKCTTAQFEGFIKPENANDKRYVVQKSTQAALDFAAVMAQAARVFSRFEAELPGMSDRCLQAARKAWDWAASNPAVLYEQDKMNLQHDPDVVTGAYAGGDLTDEFIWAAMELCVTSGEKKYFRAVSLFPNEYITLQEWNDVRTMGYLTLLRHQDKLGDIAGKPLQYLRNMFLAFADGMVMSAARQAYLTPMETDARNFLWGSNAVCANQGMALIYAFRHSGKRDYLHFAIDNLDYLLGRNATGYSYVTGYGHKTPMFPHHRPSATDDIPEPVPGLLAGGPNPEQQDGCQTYPSKLPDESYTDDACSYASNEVAINWNAPLVYLTFALELLMNE